MNYEIDNLSKKISNLEKIKASILEGRIKLGKILQDMKDISIELYDHLENLKIERNNLIKNLK